MLCLLQPSDWQYKKGLQDSLLGITPQVSTICLPDVIIHDQISQAFPLYIYILQVIKYWRWEQSGNKAIDTAYILLININV